MSIVIIGGNERMVTRYENLCHIKDKIEFDDRKND